MVSHLVYYQLALLAIIWLFVMLHLTGATPGRTAPPVPAQPKRKRSPAPTAFEGLTHKPHCALCAPEPAHPPTPPPVPPDPMPPTNRRPREVDPSMHFCPHLGCDYRGWLGMNNLRAHGHPNGGLGRQFQCPACEGYFPEHHGTIFHGKQAAVELIVHVRACLAEGLGIRATARVFEVEANTVLPWLVDAAEPLPAFSAYFLCALHVPPLQLDELYAVLRDLQAGVLSEDEAMKRLERSPSWVWTAMDPDSKLVLVIDGGMRTLEMAQRVGHHVVERWAPGCVPLCLTDGLKDYGTAFLTHVGQWMHPAQRRDKGPRPKPRGVPVPELLYAQGGKSYRRRRIGGVTYRVVCGTLERVPQVLSACGRQMNTAFVERLNLDLRQRVAAVGRRVNTLCQSEEGVRPQLAVDHVYYNCCLPHTSLRQPLVVPEPTTGSGSPQRWRPCTPAMAAGLADHVWRLTEVLCSRVPPWPQPQM